MDDLLAQRLVRPMIIVGPTANRGFLDDSECLNAVGGPQIETYLTRDVVGFVDAHYRTVADRRGRGIGGISAGGYCALNLGLRHQDEFSVVLAHMPYGDPGPEEAVTRRLLGGQAMLYRANSPRLYLDTMTFSHPLAVFMDVGSKDTEVLPQARSLAALLLRDRQEVDLRVVPGEAHTWRLGRDELPFSLSFASSHFDRTIGSS
jgi:enterochelin esterase-like enzyme